MCNFREKWEINLRNYNALTHFISQFLTTSVKSKVAIRRAIVRLSDRLLMNLWHGFCFLNEESSSHRFGRILVKLISRKFCLFCPKRFCWFYKRYLFLTCYNGGSYVRKYMFEIVFFLIILLKHVARPEI